jgi:AraC family transcriptional regulator
MSYAIQRTMLAPQAVVVARKRVSRSEISSAIPELLSRVFVFAQSKGIPLAGFPLSRYSDPSLGQVTIESGIRVAILDEKQGTIPEEWLDGNGSATLESLPGGPAALVLHTGSYERLQDAYAAIERWMSEQEATPAGPPWECYLTDPAAFPDPKDWKTEVYWPLQE